MVFSPTVFMTRWLVRGFMKLLQELLSLGESCSFYSSISIDLLNNYKQAIFKLTIDIDNHLLHCAVQTYKQSSTFFCLDFPITKSPTKGIRVFALHIYKYLYSYEKSVRSIFYKMHIKVFCA